MYATIERSIICGDCGLPNPKSVLQSGQSHQCQHCNKLLYTYRPQWIQHCSAYLLAALICFIISYTTPFLVIELSGQQYSLTVLEPIYDLYQQEYWFLALLVLVTIFLFSFFELAALVIILLSIACYYRGAWLRGTLKLLSQVRPWNMLEVFMISILVTSVKLSQMATMIPATGVLAFFAFAVFLIAAHQSIDFRWLWDWVKRENYFDTLSVKASDKSATTSISCHHCQALVTARLAETAARCPRCYSGLHQRTHQSLQKTLALLIASIICYIPANTLPILHSTSLGAKQSDTIISGAIYLYQNGDWLIATVITIASIGIPLFKLVIIGLLVASIYWNFNLGATLKMQLYRFTIIIGRWSMIDVFVVVTLAATLQFGAIATVSPGSAVLPFAMVVILTMLAVETFDPRLMWDRNNE